MTRSYALWDAQADARLLALVESGKTLHAAATEMARSKESVASRWAKIRARTASAPVQPDAPPEPVRIPYISDVQAIDRLLADPPALRQVLKSARRSVRELMKWRKLARIPESFAPLFEQALGVTLSTPHRSWREGGVLMDGAPMTWGSIWGDEPVPPYPGVRVSHFAERWR
ncbi:hypothetical protein [Acidomonas methanolica]|uniref:Uncharacterized protein n=1 Tax=Acidomonas methanolica NBRC 104435 TaxID=1231351 RepID=A0A023D7G8_ACIMT|nr:hypothetical protein [Acidomonas methanolica]TCS24134.1 hypothetical protein EDC31_12555 [Acidomonas methanolica]GAJ29711.1 hypothetical protein Amme_076_004 [Acidomonas methanolica NBRC 104435]GBQ59521.1 hypothetical protein AA0498_2775 [Acidomonas methanolica]GEL00050.1 hypothetical protein AME01nite_25480 [Acidomonas methanolica NBRC 104435]